MKDVEVIVYLVHKIQIKMEKVKDGELGIAKPIANESYWFQYIVALSGKIINFEQVSVSRFFL